MEKVETDLSCIGVYFPSAFVPNGKNNSFSRLGSLAAITNYRFSIYNRWGERDFILQIPLKNRMEKKALQGLQMYLYGRQHLLYPLSQMNLERGSLL